MRIYVITPALCLISLASAQVPTTCTTTAQNVAPSVAICGKQGAVKNQSPISTSNKNNQTVCRDSCLNNQPQCVAFSYGPKKTCKTYNKRIWDQGFKQSNTGVTFWNRRCYGKKCGLCPTGLEACGAQCYNTQTDLQNCGQCGSACPVGEGSACCGGECTTLKTDEDNCGSCGNACGEGQYCCQGECKSTSADDDFNCGSCGNSCGSGKRCCSGQCVSNTNDPNNCGSCGNTVTNSDDICCSGEIVRGDTKDRCGSCINSCPGELQCINPNLQQCRCTSGDICGADSCCKNNESCDNDTCMCGNGPRCNPNDEQEICVSGNPSDGTYRYTCGNTRCCFIYSDNYLSGSSDDRTFALLEESSQLIPDISVITVSLHFAAADGRGAHDARSAAQKCYNAVSTNGNSFALFYTTDDQRWNCYGFEYTAPPDETYDSNVQAYISYGALPL